MHSSSSPSSNQNPMLKIGAMGLGHGLGPPDLANQRQGQHKHTSVLGS